MQNKIYSIKEASEELELENHTLRYYEDELELSIPRNSLGHRYYREYDMKIFRDIRVLKEQGLQLKAIKSAIQGYYDPIGGDNWDESSETYMQASATTEESKFDITDTNNTKVEQFRLMMKQTFVQAIYENEEELKSELSHHIKYKIEEDMKEEIQKIEDIYEEKDKERYRKLDETMREMQKIRVELIEITEQKKEKRSLFNKMFGKKNLEIYQEDYVNKE
ncbi:MAG TPA: MerR family transcriptional regulator [Epulopiscium sp.]|nr:MerR family transcriptional regulator [Candidatus Epulonipiscium sp.]